MGISLWKLQVILAFVEQIFGTTRLRNPGAELVAAIWGLCSALRDNVWVYQVPVNDLNKNENIHQVFIRHSSQQIVITFNRL
jgi:Sec-independent protein translocase protein TatA